MITHDQAKAVKAVEDMTDALCRLEVWYARADFAIKYLTERYLIEYKETDTDFRDIFFRTWFQALITHLRKLHAIPSMSALSALSDGSGERGNEENVNEENVNSCEQTACEQAEAKQAENE